MRRSKWLAMLSVGVLAGSIALWATRTTSLADTKTATYKSSKVCTMCHKGTTPKIVEGWLKTGHAKALQAATDDGAIVADFANAPIKKDAVKWVLGKGVRAQAYIGADMKVLPAEWQVASKSWKTIPADDATASCLGCHTTGYDATAKTYSDAGVACEACHGPGSDHISGADKKATIVVPTKLAKDRAPMVCGQCHSKGLSTDKVHTFPVGYRPGDDLTAVFVDGKPTSPGRNQQYSEFATSKHAAMGMNCETCHDPHGTTGLEDQLKKPINEQCLGCHAGKIKDIKTHQPNAPADATCATCHMPGGVHTFKKPGA